MPATEQTWYESKFLHMVFGITSLLMLVTTLWMLAADHLREWKDVQRKFRDIETWTVQSRLDEQKTGKFDEETKQLKDKLASIRAQVPSKREIDEFVEIARTPMEQSSGIPRTRAEVNGYRIVEVFGAWNALSEAKKRNESRDELVKKHQALVLDLEDVQKKAKFDEDNRQRDLKFARADLDVLRSRYSLGVDEGMTETQLAKIQEQVEKTEERVNQLTLFYQAAKTHRLALDGKLNDIVQDEAAAKKELDDHTGIATRLEKAEYEKAPNLGKEILEMPIIDAFGRPLKVEQIWLPTLTLNNNFRDVARFDRCTTCHQGIDKTAPGSARNPGYDQRHEVVVALETPKTPPKATQGKDGKTEAPTLSDVYGLKLADKSPVDPAEVMIDVVWPRTPAAKSGLQSGDAILMIGDAKIRDQRRAKAYLLDSVKWGQPLSIKVLRGVPQPFSSHPRLDLFVGSLSPHKMGEVGCTICHEGQGSATAFKWASHTPNNPQQGAQWKRDHGWFNNHHWIFPMNPQRFAESSCLKCHQDVTELETSEKFPEPPAAKLMAGYNTIRQYGCFGCHEINGYDGPNRRRGPDLRVEPPYYAAAAEMLIDPALTKEQRRLAQEIVDHPDQTSARKLLAESIRESVVSDADSKKGPKLTAMTAKMGEMLGADDATPGQLRRVGPSLRFVGSKVDREFLYNWIREPKNFRPTTKMPQFFGLYAHLLPDQKIGEDGKLVFKDGQPVMVDSPGLVASKRFEPIEIRGVTEYLLASSQKFEYASHPKDVKGPASAERGKQQFQIRGCLACHRHPDFPDAKSTQGPDLSKLGSKLTGTRGADWLYSWVRAPNRYHSRTVMPNLFLEPIKGADDKLTDPAADIAVFLLKSQGWKPTPVPAVDSKDLNDLVVMFLSASFTHKQAEEYVARGIPADMASGIKGDEIALVTDRKLSPQELTDKKLLYVGRRTISRLGCSGCHDIPGYEDAKPIGTGLADWGRKETSKLAFEQILPYLQETLSNGHGGHGLSTRDMSPDQGFYVETLLSHQREGFIWQKLREPRSYDYKKTETKGYADRLRMPQFKFTAEQREAVITFVLGLVAEPPAARYVYKASPRREAIIKGERLLSKYNCTGCHMIQMDQWDFDYKPYDGKDDTSFQPPPKVVDYSFVLPHFTPQQLAASEKVDRRGLGHAEITGMPNPEVGEDDDGNPLYYFGLWESDAIDGRSWPAGGQEVPLTPAQITQKRPPHGGDFARLLHPVALAIEKKSNPNAKASDAWGWGPPPLLHEGIKVQTGWLHDFLLDPYQIRPAVVLRMPRFNMSSDEASQLADYFAAVDNAQYPYEFDPRTRADYLESENQRHPHRLDDALKIVTDNNYCVKCHRIGDFVPQGALSAQAPRLDRVAQRLRPEFVERWIANPKRLLPYTGMPVNFPIDKPADQKLFHGTSQEQVEAVVDLLLNWPTFMKDRQSIKPMVKPAAPTPTAAAGK